jgi:hypothetical protein
MNKIYEQPNLEITSMRDDVIRTSGAQPQRGVMNFNASWLTLDDGNDSNAD